MQTGTMENFQTITKTVDAGSEPFIVKKMASPITPVVWAYFISDDRLTLFRNGRERSHQYSLLMCERAISYNPARQQFMVMKDRWPSGGKFNRMSLVTYCKEYLDCDVDMNGCWVNPDDAIFFHLKWAGQPNQSF